ncbi:MAG: hypothetical protein K9H49_11995 [Bacteroidales bacterium]|nr:hypothetical protein [Bacteroidales bacterium]MCF8390795.1 hypothetical protein [Bacteroidales bacterium]
MRKNKLFGFSLIILAILFNSCEDKKFQTYTANVPVYLSYDELRESVKIEEAVPLKEPGKIYFKGNYIFINEYMKGIHVIDITNPSDPSPLSFINIPGNVDMAIKDNILYADSYIDIVLIDISIPSAPVEINRLDSILSYTLPSYNNKYPMATIDAKKGVVTGWKVEEYTQEIYNNPHPWGIYYEYSYVDAMSSSKSPSSVGGAVYGVGGSMARFATYDQYLYLLEQTSKLKVIDISDVDSPELSYDKYVGWGLETMFIYEDYMYLGATNGLHILDLHFPNNPIKTAEYNHITSCDPVVVSGNTAYVTLRSGNICGGTADLLEVVNVTNKSNPVLLASYPMNEPYGLGISGNTLFICQGDNGLVVYDVLDKQNITNHKLAEFSNIHAIDVIPLDSLLFTIGNNGFYIYDYSDVNNIFLLSTIEISE